MIRRRLESERGRAGGALLVALIATSSLMVLGATFYQLSAASAKQALREVDERRAFHLAEAGVAEAMVALRAGMTGAVGTAAAPAYLEDGVLWVERTDLGGGQTRLVAHGACGSGRAALEATVELAPANPIFYAVLNSRETMTLNSSVAIDSFDSALGTYASQATNTYGVHTYAGSEGDVTSNEGIVLNSQATVFGDATPGPGYGVSFAMGSYVAGSTAPSAQVFSFPPIVAPALVSIGDLTVAPNATTSVPPGDHAFDALSIGKDGTLLVEGPANIVVTDFTGGKDGNLIVDATNGPVTFFVANNYSHVSGFEAQAAAGSPMAVAFMIEGTQDVVFPSSTMVRGAYYAPNANILFGATNEAWGSFAANRIDMSNDMKFHYDESLADHWNSGGPGSDDPLDFLAWRPSVVSAAMKNDRRDPFVLLGVAPGALAAPAQSWQ